MAGGADLWDGCGGEDAVARSGACSCSERARRRCASPGLFPRWWISDRTPEGPWAEPYETGALVEGSESASDASRARPADLLLESTLRSVDDLLRALAPRPRVEEVELDVDSPLVRPGATAATRGEFEDARASFEEVHSRHPELPAAAYDLGLVMEALGHWEEAEALYTDAVSKKPDDRLYRDALDSVRARLHTSASGFPP